MTLATLKSSLQTLTGTSIAQVIFEWETYRNEVAKTYPLILWALDNTEFSKDARTSTIQDVKIITLPVFIFQRYDAHYDDKIALWDTLEGYLDVYLNAMNIISNLQVININSIKGAYIPEGVMGNSEIGILYKDVQLKMFC